VATRRLIPRLTDIIEAIERIRSVMEGMTLDTFEADMLHSGNPNHRGLP
jgi:uncharacterized protein with HEPN domain